jgi:hypothetical protein
MLTNDGNRLLDIALGLTENVLVISVLFFFLRLMVMLHGQIRRPLEVMFVFNVLLGGVM